MKPVALFLLALPLLAQPPVNVQVLNSHGHSMDGVTVQPIADDPSWARIGANGRGANWSHGSPPNDQIAASVEYEEHRYVLKQFRFIDSRGKLADGTIWRYLGQLGESADYETKDPAAAKELDKILDKVCLAGPRR